MVNEIREELSEQPINPRRKLFAEGSIGVIKRMRNNTSKLILLFHMKHLACKRYLSCISRDTYYIQ